MNFENKNNDTIDFFKLFEIFWENRKIVYLFIFIFSVISLFFVFKSNDRYESLVEVHFNNLPPFIDNKIAFNDYQRFIYDKRIFDSWKTTKDQSILKFTDLNKTKLVNGTIFSKNENELLINSLFSKDKFSLKINTNSFQLLNEVYSYLSFLNSLIKEQYRIRAQNEINKINMIIKSNKLSGDSSETISKTLNLGRFLDNIDKGIEIYEISHPTEPSKHYINHITKTIILLTIGFLFSFFVIIIKHEIIQYKSRKK